MIQDKSEFEIDGKENQAMFNMAIDTLKRLSEILENIQRTCAEITIPVEAIQKRKLYLVKQFFIQSCPLLDSDYKNENKDKIIKIRPKEIPIYEMNSSGGKGKFKGYKFVYDEELDNLLDNLLIDIQDKLQEKGHFMPPKDEGGLFE